MQRRHFLAFPVAAGLFGCSEPTASEDPIVYPESAIEVVSPRFHILSPGDRVAELPSLRVYRPKDDSGISGREVVFIVQPIDDPSTRVVVLTDSRGIAELPEWKVGEELGVYTVTAIFDRNQVVFRAVIPGEIVAIYDLSTLDGRPPPLYGLHTAHYVLYEGGVLNLFMNTPVKPLTGDAGVFGVYNIDESNVLLQVAEPDRLGWVGIPGYGTINERAMTIQRGHELDDFPVERYVRR